jgi:hypothetical protein
VLNPKRRGISLLEVLISIFVLAVGLLSVAALIPAGRHEIAQGSRLEYASMIGRAAFRDLKVRGMLNPQTWRDATGNPLSPSPHVAVAIDPLGVLANYGNDFAYNPPALQPRLRRITMPAFAQAAVADSVFRSSVDLITEENPTSNLPPLQFWFRDPANTDPATNHLRRASDGNYSWLATIVSDQTRPALVGKVTVSVAVFHKRIVTTPGEGEYVARAIPASSTSSGIGLGGGEVSLSGIPAAKTIKPGDWIMLTAQRLASLGGRTFTYDYYRWYRVVSAGNKSGPFQNVTLAGTDWDETLLKAETWAYLFDNIVAVLAVYEKNMTLEVQ